MKKQYIIPNTTMEAFCAGFICSTTSPAAGTVIGGGTLGGGGEAPAPIDPM